MGDKKVILPHAVIVVNENTRKRKGYGKLIQVSCSGHHCPSPTVLHYRLDVYLCIASGFVGEVVKASYLSGAVSGGIGPANAITLTLPGAGVWRITASASFLNSSSYVNSAAAVGIAITTTSGKDPTSVVATENESCALIRPYSSNNNMNLQVSCSVDSYVGSGPVYVTIISGGYSSGTQAAYAYAKAVRIA